MMLSSSTATAARALLPAGRRSSPSAPFSAKAATSGSKRNLVVRFRESERPASASDTEKLKEQLPPDSRVSAEDINRLRYKEPGQNMYYPSAAEMSNKTAEIKADMGKAIDFWQSQSFDGPAPETINSRLSMLGVLVGLIGEWTTGLGLMQQTADHPLILFGVFLLISFASYIPIARGYTRKEPFSNHLLGFDWTPHAENWNGRIAMLGFAGMVLTEFITGVNTLQAWGLQSVPFPHL